MSNNRRERSLLDLELALAPGYVSRDAPDYYDDDEASDLVRQPDVYGLARALAERFAASAIVDLGCGKAVKLVDIGAGIRLIGADFGENLDYCRDTFPEHEWIDLDLEQVDPQWATQLPDGAIVMSSDVIEHLRDPRPLLRLLALASQRAAAVVVSTPERHLVHGPGHLGPPTLGAHVREWSLDEFRRLLLSYDLPVVAIGTTRSSVGTDQAATIVAVMASDFKGVASQSRARRDDLVSPIFETVDAHLDTAENHGYDIVGITGADALTIGTPRDAAAPTRNEPGGDTVRCRPGEGTRLFPFNLLRSNASVDGDLLLELADRHLPIALTGRDPTQDLWPRAARRWLLHREDVLSAGLMEAKDIEADLRTQLDDLRGTASRIEEDLRLQVDDLRSSSTEIQTDLHRQLDDARTIERDLRASIFRIENTFDEEMTRERSRGDELVKDNQRLYDILDDRRRMAERSANAALRTVPHHVTASELTVPPRWGRERIADAVGRRALGAAASVADAVSGRLRPLAPLKTAAAEWRRKATSPQSTPSWLFDEEHYLDAMSSARTSDVSAWAHYTMLGWKLGVSPHPLFVPGWYLAKNPSVAEAGIDPLHHFVTVGWVMGLDPHPLFSTAWYLERSPDVKSAGMNPLEHYLTFGWLEGRDPHPMFDTAGYLARRPDVAAAGVNPLIHYVQYGWREGTPPSEIFDGTYYRTHTPECALSGLPDYWYYLEIGADLGDWPSGWTAELAGRSVRASDSSVQI